METKRARVALLGAMAAIGLDLEAMISAASRAQAAKRDDHPRLRDISTEDYVKDWHGSVVRNYTKSAPKKVRSKARRVHKVAMRSNGWTPKQIRQAHHITAPTV